MGMKKSEAKTNAAVRMIHLLRGEKFIQSVQPRHILTGSDFAFWKFLRKAAKSKPAKKQVLVLQASPRAEATKQVTKWLSFKSSAKSESCGRPSTPTSRAVSRTARAKTSRWRWPACATSQPSIWRRERRARVRKKLAVLLQTTCWTYYTEIIPMTLLATKYS